MLPAVNEAIVAPMLRLIDEEGNQVGIVARAEAFNRARDVGLDLVEITNKSNPPVVKIIDAGKYFFDLKKKEKENTKKQRASIIETKEIYLRPVTNTHDIEIKINRIREFLADGNKVKIAVKFRGREGSYKEQGFEILNNILNSLEDFKIERPIQDGGREVSTLIMAQAAKPVDQK